MTGFLVKLHAEAPRVRHESGADGAASGKNMGKPWENHRKIRKTRKMVKTMEKKGTCDGKTWKKSCLHGDEMTLVMVVMVVTFY